MTLAAAGLLMISASCGTALAGDPWEAWPEANAFVGLSQQVRLYLVEAYATGKESTSEALDVAGYVDISLKPILRPALLQEDWQRSRYVWARIGYDHVFKAEAGAPAPSEDRGIVSLYGRAHLPADVWFEGRARADLRWIDGEYSTRYRLRGELNHEFALGGHVVTPYVQVECFYDDRYDGWARMLYQVGPEVTVNKGFRFEVYLARQEDKLPRSSALNAYGLVGKWYF